MEKTETEPLEATQPPQKPHLLSPEEVLHQLATLAGEGLSSAEVIQRQAEYGLNQLTEAPQTTFWEMLWVQLNNFIVILLLIAAVISALLGDWFEAGAIMAIVVLNAGLGVIQERRAEEALAALRKLAAPEAQVVRDGQRHVIPARELVPGDIVVLEAGNYIPADVRLLEAVNLRVEEAALTGESVPVSKDANIQFQDDVPIGDRKNTTFMGTLINYGRGRGIVVNTGMRTEIGRIAEMLQAVKEEPTPLQQRLDGLGRTLGWACFRGGRHCLRGRFAARHQCARHVPAGRYPGHRRRARRLAGGRHDQPGVGDARDDQAACAHPPVGIRRDAGVGHRDRLG